MEKAMMKIKSSMLVLFLISAMSSIAQDKQFTIQDLIPGGRSSMRFVPRSIRQLQWLGDNYIYVRGDTLMQGDCNGQESIALTLENLNKAFSAAGLETTKMMPYFSIPDNTKKILVFNTRRHLLHYDMTKGAIIADYQIEKDARNQDFCNENGYFAYTIGNNLRIVSPENKITEITHETNPGVVCGRSVHQNEFGIHKGTFWSPKGSALAFYRMDESMVAEYPLVNIDTRIATVEPFKYPMAGTKSHEVTIGIYNFSTGTTVFLETGLPKEKYLTNIAWSPDEKNIYIAELNREQNDMHLVRFSAVTGKKEIELFEETDSRYVEPTHAPLFRPNHPDQFIWQSERDGFNHAYLFNTDGKLIRQLTKGEWVVTDIQGFDSKGDYLFVTGTAPMSGKGKGSSMQSYTWRVDVKSGKMTCLTKEIGVHYTNVNPSGNYMIDNFQSPSVPRSISIVRTKDGKETAHLMTAPNPFIGYKMPEITTGTIKAADDSTNLNYLLVKPTNFDPDKKYPVIIYVYGGPHAQLVNGGWLNGCSGWDIYMAQKGYVVFTVDSRGSSNRGHSFESVIHRNLGVNEMADQIKGVEFLKSLPYVDASRIGVHGWSYGGFMTVNLMTTYPNIFKTAVAGGPVIDWSEYEIMYGERYMDRPQDNPDGYKNANLKLKAGNLKGHLLLIHGTSDNVVMWQHSLGFIKACIEAGTYPDYFVYPGHQHNVVGKDRVHLYEKITRYFDDYLK